MAVSQAALDFGEALRRARELRGISLDDVAEATKISASIIGGLERGDLSRWPTGIFRRAFVRAYAEAVGLPVDRLVDAFNDVHGVGAGENARPAMPIALDEVERTNEDGLRLQLAGRPERTRAAIAGRVVGVAIDIALPAVVGYVVAEFAGVQVLAAIGAAALVSLASSSAAGKGTWGQVLARLPERARHAVLPVPVTPSPVPVSPSVVRDVSVAEPRRNAEPVRVGPRRRSGRDRARAPRPSRHA